MASGGDIRNRAVLNAAVAAASEPGDDASKAIHQRHLEGGIRAAWSPELDHAASRCFIRTRRRRASASGTLDVHDEDGERWRVGRGQHCGTGRRM